MELSQRTHDGWWNYERRNWAALALLLGGIGFALGQGATNQEYVQATVAPVVAHDKAVTKQVVQLQTKVIPELKSEAGCQKWRGDVATTVAKADDGDPSRIPNCPPLIRPSIPK